MNLETELNQEQLLVLESPAKKKLVIAGPGSGKTKLLVQAIVEAGCEKSEIIAITYTNAAANELEARIQNHVQMNVSLGFCGTLHAFCMKLIRQRHELVDLPANPAIIDDEQREDLVKQIMDEMGIKCSLSKAMEATLLFRGMGMMAITKEGLLAKEYHLRMNRAGLLDFNRVLMFGRRILERWPVEDWPYTHLFVDELQDAANEDWEIYGTMPCEHKFLVGDPDQAIYGFRGGNVRNMVTAAELWGNPKRGGELNESETEEVFALETNYRSGRAICEAAQNLIERNTVRYAKTTLTHQGDSKVVFSEFESPGFEMVNIASMILHYGPKKCAILTRTNRLATEWATFLKENGCPVAETKYHEQPIDWKRAKLLLTILQAPWNDLLVYQFLSNEMGFGAVKTEAAKRMVSINEHLGFRFGMGDTAASSMDVDLSKHAISQESRERIHDACRELSRRSADWNLADLVLFLNQEEPPEIGEGCTVTTIHQAKGREWDNVFLVGFEEGIIPKLRKNTAKGDEIEEERRLAYVGMTRARLNLYITWSKVRARYNGPYLPLGAPETHERSRFIGEMLKEAK